METAIFYIIAVAGFFGIMAFGEWFMEFHEAGKQRLQEARDRDAAKQLTNV